MRIIALGALVVLASASSVTAQAAHRDLVVRIVDEWVPWWSAARAPTWWEAGDPTIEAAAGWTPVAAGVDYGQVTIRRAAEPWKIRVVLVRLDPERVGFRLTVPPRRADGFAGRWSIDDAPQEALVAVNAGQFTSGPWGWLVRDGRTLQRPRRGRLAPGVAVFASGRVGILPADSLEAADDVVEGFQSYPSLLEGSGSIPPELREGGRGVDLTHRDGRLALGVLRDGTVILALTRLEGLGGLLEIVPFGPTTPEMAAVMGALGCERAVLLDGGISGQMTLQSEGRTDSWRGLRQVASGLLALPRDGRSEAR